MTRESKNYRSDERLGVSTVTTVEGLLAIRGQWLRLAQRAGTVLPFLLPEWTLAWWETFRQDRRLIHDSLHVKLVWRPSGELAALFPFVRTQRPSRGPLRARSLGFLGADEYVTEQRAAVVDPECEAGAARALAAHLLEDDSWDWIRWEGLSRGSAFATTLSDAMHLQWGSAQTSNLLRLAPTWEEFRSGLKRNIKESLRHCYNSLKRDGLTARLAVAESGAEVDAALGAFFDLHGKRAAGKEMVAHPNRFEREKTRRFLRTVCARLAERGVARVFTLYVGDVAVASRIGFLLSGCLYLYYSGFDPEWKKYSVMTTTVAEAIKYAIARGVPQMHLSMGADVSKSRWGPEMTAMYEATCVRPRLSSHVALQLYTWGRSSSGVRRALDGVLPSRRFD
jgi:CelD/BcsL family acetyltransferase involved in cellulose biosynthesis